MLVGELTEISSATSEEPARCASCPRLMIIAVNGIQLGDYVVGCGAKGRVVAFEGGMIGVATFSLRAQPCRRVTFIPADQAHVLRRALDMASASARHAEKNIVLQRYLERRSP